MQKTMTIVMNDYKRNDYIVMDEYVNEWLH